VTGCGTPNYLPSNVSSNAEVSIIYKVNDCKASTVSLKDLKVPLELEAVTKVKEQRFVDFTFVGG